MNATTIDFDALANAISPDQLAQAIGATKAADGYRCPIKENHHNGDHRPSLSISRTGGRTVSCCHSCGLEGSPIQVAAAVWKTSLQDAAERLVRDLGISTVETSRAGLDEIVAQYDYTDENGELLYQVVRLFPKSFRQRRPDGRGGWTWKLGDVRRVIYRLPAIVEAVALGKPVYICEGERDVYAIESLGAVATTAPGGAGKWRPEYSEVLRGAVVRIVADDDEPGEKHARAVADALEGVATSVEILKPRTGKDAADHIAAGHGLEDFVPLDKPDSVFTTVAELQMNPDLLKPPEAILPRLGYRGRLLLLAGPDKSGKSTLLSHGASALSRGAYFLGEPCKRGRVVLLGLEEAPGDAVRRFVELGADTEAIQMVTRAPRDLLDQTRQLLTVWPADLVIVDSLSEYARVTGGVVPDDGDNAGWAAVIRPLVALAREHNVAVIVLHHVRKTDGTYRGPTELAAAADALLELSLVKDDPSARLLKGRGRWDILPFTVTLTDGQYKLSGAPELSVDALVLLCIEQNPGASLRKVRESVGARASTVTAVLNRLIERGAIVDRGQGDRRKFFVATGAQTEANYAI